MSPNSDPIRPSASTRASVVARFGWAIPVAIVLVGLAPAALELRDLGVAQLENERPAEAEKTFSRLVKVAPEDPLGYANLAIAALRQQKNVQALAMIDRALELSPNRADLLAIKGEVLQWSGRPEMALATHREAARLAPDDPEILFALFRQGDTMEGELAEAAQDEALDRLAELRPENLVVLLSRGQRAIADGDRATTSEAFLRIGELLWQAPPIAEKALEMVVEALESGDVASAEVPALRLENVLKVTPMYQQGLRELDTGIQGIPVARFEDEPPPTAFGDPLDLEWTAHELDGTAGGGLAVVDLDGDRRPDLIRSTATAIEVRTADGGWSVASRIEGVSGRRLLPADLDNDGFWDVVATGPDGVAVLRGDGTATLKTATRDFGFEGVAGGVAAAVDLDIEGDLDLVVGAGAIGVFRNSLEGPLEAVGSQSLPDLDLAEVRDLAVSDLDRDGDLDLAVAHPGGVLWLDNLRQGELADRTGRSGLDGVTSARWIDALDLDNDSFPDLVVAGDGIDVWTNLRDGRFEATLTGLPTPGTVTAIVGFDADNDGRLDLAVGGDEGIVLLHQQSRLDFEVEPLPRSASVTALAAADLDGDGDLDLVADGPEGLAWLENGGGDRNHWLAVELRGLTKGNSKNNVFGLGTMLEVKAGRASQFREAEGDVVHFGLGDLSSAEVLRVVWTNGVPQNRLDVGGDTRIVEEQVLKGSCPFLYAWNGEEMAFVTDLLWGAPLGLPVAPGIWAPADPRELVEVEEARPRDGTYELRVTEELWEAAFVDEVRLWIVDHPEDVEVASSLAILPGETIPERVHGSRDLRPVARALDGRGHDVTDRVRHRDDVYADGYEAGPYQGLAARPWTITFDLGEAPGTPVRLHLDGWIFPSDASLNLAMAQRQGLVSHLPRLEVETADGWRPLLDPMPFPAGKTKTMVVDTPPLPPESRRLRIVTTQWLHWDRIAWTTEIADEVPVVIDVLEPDRAELRYRGFSRLVRRAPNAPHDFDYDDVSRTAPWLPFPGRYTRYGDVAPLLGSADDRNVVLGAGDELALTFDASELEPPETGWARTVFLESFGWDKDADRNTWEARQVEPLPFAAMSGYPWSPDESPPDDPAYRRYREEWLTRIVLGPGRAAPTE